MKITFDFKKKHKKSNRIKAGYIQIDDIQLPRVTTITKVIHRPGLFQWVIGKDKIELDKILKESSDYGIEMHKKIANWIRDGCNVVSDLNPNFTSWFKKNIFGEFRTEQFYFSKELGYCGTPDLVTYEKNNSCLYDWKTSGDIYQEHFLQLAGYQALIERKTYGVNSLYVSVENAIIVWMPKENKNIVKIATIPGDILRNNVYPIFLSCLKIFNWQKDFAFRKETINGK